MEPVGRSPSAHSLYAFADDGLVPTVGEGALPIGPVASHDLPAVGADGEALPPVRHAPFSGFFARIKNFFRRVGRFSGIR